MGFIENIYAKSLPSGAYGPDPNLNYQKIWAFKEFLSNFRSRKFLCKNYPQMYIIENRIITRVSKLLEFPKKTHLNASSLLRTNQEI